MLTTTWFRVALLALLLVVCAWVPLLSAEIPPMLDYPNHLARQHIIKHIADSPLLQSYYQIGWRASPYLAFDAIVQTLATVMPINVAGKAFAGLVLLLLGLVPMVLNVALFGRVMPTALLGLLFIHNGTVTLGFVNYLLGVSLALCAFAVWVRFGHASLRVRLVLFPFLCGVVFFSHLLGYMIYLVLVSAYELGRYVDRLRGSGAWAGLALNQDERLTLLSIWLQCALPLAIFFAFGPTRGYVSANIHGGLERKLDLMLDFFTYLIPPYSWPFDRALQLGVPLALLLLLIGRRLRIGRDMLWPLAAILVFFVAMPSVLFGGWGADHRLLPVVGLFVVGVLQPVQPRSATLWRAAFVGIGLLALARVFFVTSEWGKADGDLAEYRRAFEHVPDGSRMYFAFGHPERRTIVLPEPTRGGPQPRPVYHLPLMILQERSVYVPFLFASNPGGTFSLYYRDQKQVLPWSPGPVLTHGESPDWANLIDRFDYFLLVGEQHFKQRPPPELVPVFSGPTVRLYRHTGKRS